MKTIAIALIVGGIWGIVSRKIGITPFEWEYYVVVIGLAAIIGVTVPDE